MGGRLILNIVGVIDIAIGWARIVVTDGGLLAVNFVDVSIGITVQRGIVITIVERGLLIGNDIGVSRVIFIVIAILIASAINVLEVVS